MDPDGIRIQPAKKLKRVIPPRLGHFDVEEKLADRVVAVVVIGAGGHDVGETHHGDVDLLLLVGSPEDRTVLVQRPLHDRIRRRWIHLLRSTKRRVEEGRSSKNPRLEGENPKRREEVPAEGSSWRPRGNGPSGSGG